MDITLLKHLGNLEQLCGIRESRLLEPDMRITEVYNAAGLRFTLLPDRCMDIYDLSYRGINLSFQTKNGLRCPEAVSAAEGEFIHQWSGGALVTCGLDNVGAHTEAEGRCPDHGRITAMRARHYGTFAGWEGEDYLLRAQGEIHQARLNGSHLSIRRTLETGLQERCIRLRDVITNHEAEPEPFMLLYHCNFGYPLLQSGSEVAVTKGNVEIIADHPCDWQQITGPVDGMAEESFLHTHLGPKAAGVLYNRSLGLGVYLRWDTTHLPNMLQWKNLRSHDYVLALEPCNTYVVNREEALKTGKIAVLPAYSSITVELEMGILDGLDEIQCFLNQMNEE